MKRWYYLLFLFLLCLAFTACGRKETMKLSKGLKTEIEEAWASCQKDYTLQWDITAKYYGTYDGKEAFFDAGGMRTTAETTKRIAGSEFFWPTAFSITVYSDGKFFDLEEAYKKNMLTKEDIQSIAKQHDAWVSAQMWAGTND